MNMACCILPHKRSNNTGIYRQNFNIFPSDAGIMGMF